MKYFMYLVFILIHFSSFTLGQINFNDPNEQSTKKIFGDTSAKTTDSSQAIYEQGGENDRYRITETEKGLDFVKKELFSLKSEVASLKLEIENLKKLSKEASSTIPANNQPTNYNESLNQPRKKPTPY